MNRGLILILLFPFLITSGFSQKSSTDPEFEAQAIGGKQHIEQILQTQLSLPKQLLSSGFKSEFITYFDLDSIGKAQNIKYDGQIPLALSKEMTRLFRFFSFKHTLNLPNESRPYFLKFSISTEKYKSFIKQKSKFNLKLNETADSSLMVYSRADQSPEFYKNGDEGFNAFMLSEIEYPRLAIEKSIEGTVVLEFVVETNGFITNLEVKKGVNGGCTEEALRLIKFSRWKPATLNGKLVRYKMTAPITFNLRNVNKSYESSNSTFGQ
jgi:TonB family protein